MFDKYFKELVDLYFENDYTNLSTNSDIKELLPRLFLFYQIHNADPIAIDEMEEGIIRNDYIQAIIPSIVDDQGFDIFSAISKEDLDPKNILSTLDKIDRLIINVINGISNDSTRLVREEMIKLNAINHSELNVMLLTDAFIDFKLKIEIKNVITKYKSQLSTVSYNILFGDDIEEVIFDIDAPSMFVKEGQLILSNKKSIMFHGSEESLVTSINAKSLKEVYKKSANSGLFASNLRYYVKSAKIDDNIKSTIQEEPEKFWYFNNGIIITCDNYRIEDDLLKLTNFSIVNGGQTTNLVGNTDFEEDFPILCKVIRTKYEDYEENIMFLSKIAETSNTQKPIKTKDLIANRIEQFKLKKQLNDVGVYLQVKRGEKINKTIYKEAWQNANNDEMGQMIFSFIYQHPGISRNSKNKMLSHDPYYNKIYKNKYDSNLLISLQHLKIEYNKWKNYVSKNKKENAELVGMAKNGFFWMLGILGYLTKMYYNDELRYLINKSDPSFINSANEFMPYVSQNDIGQIPLLKDYENFTRKLNSFELFDFIFEEIAVPTYKIYRAINPAYAYSNLTKNDSSYYKHVLPYMTMKFRSDSKYSYSILSKYFYNKDEVSNVRLLTIEEQEELDKPGIVESLKEYRTKKFIEDNKSIPAYMILKDKQMEKISVSLPRTTKQLVSECSLSKIQIEKYGQDILDIVYKYLPK